MIEEFKKFALKGNVVDMAVGIMIGAAFGKIVTSLVNDVLMPPIGFLLGEVKFTQLALELKPAVGDEPAVLIKYGNFLQVTFDFLIIALVIFYLVKFINKLHAKKEEAPAAPPEPPKEQVLLEEIRDLLKK